MGMRMGWDGMEVSYVFGERKERGRREGVK